MSATEVLEKANQEVEVANQVDLDLQEKTTFNNVIKNAVNPLDTQIKTLEVKDKTVEGYFNQISYNWYIGAKATYFIARDLFSASTILSSNDYDKLKNSIAPLISRSTLDKYEKIGESDRLKNLLLKQALPMTWTTQYALATLSDEDFNKVLPTLQSTTTMGEINKSLGIEPNEKPKRYLIDKPKEFISIAYATGTADPNKMQSLVNKIQDLVKSENALRVKYSTSKNHQDFLCEMWHSNELICKEEYKVVEYYQSLDKKKSPHKDTFPKEYATFKKLIIEGVNPLFDTESQECETCKKDPCECEVA